MYTNRVWLLLLAIVGASTLFYGAKTGYKLYCYYSESTYTVTQTTEWVLVERSRTRFFPRARYTYLINGVTYSGETELSSRVYRNKWAGEEDLASYPQKPWKVWYSPARPYHSTLQKNFPLKDTLSTTLLIVILGYLICVMSTSLKAP